MISTIALAVVAVAGGLVAYAATRPSRYEFSRNVVINAPPEKIFPFINTRRIANSWNPFLSDNPTMKITVSGPETGVGAVTEWDGDKKAGAGRAEVVESVPSERVVVRLSMKRPMGMEQTAAFRLVPEAGQTRVTWSVGGDSPLIGRVMCLFMNPDKMVGDAFLRGLTKLKAMAETAG